MKDKNLFGILVASALLSTTMPVMAADVTDDKEKVLPPVLVAAQKEKKMEEKKPQEPVYSRLTVPESAQTGTETFTREDIENMHPKDVFEVLEKGLGMVNTYQGRKGLDFSQSRGGGSNIGIIIDGIYMPGSQSSRILVNFPVELIETVTIVRDGSALTLGPLTALSSAQGAPNQGFVIITTQKPSKKQNEVKVGYGTFNTEKVHLSHGDKIGDYYYDMAYTKNKTDGKDNWYNASHSDSVYLKGGYEGKDFSSNISFYSDHSAREFQRGTLPNGTLENSKWKYDPLNSCMFSIDAAKKWNAHHTTALSFGYSAVTDTMVTATFGSTTRPTYQAESNRVNEFNLWHTISSNKDTMRIGMQQIRWHSPNGELSYAKKEQQEELYGYYVFDEHKVSDKLTLDGGMRLDKHHITVGTAMSGKKIADVWAGDATSYSLGAAYKLDNVYKLSTNFTYSKQPTDEFIKILNNKVVDPEVRKKYEVGIKANYHKGLNATLTAFYYDIDNYKLLVGTQGTGANLVNIYDSANVGRKGIELGFNGQLSEQWSYNLGYSYMNSSNATDNSQIPRNTYTMRLNYKHKDINANLSVQKMGDFIGGTMPGLGVGVTTSAPVGDFTRVDVNVSKAINKDVKINLYGRNLTNQQYATIYKTGYYYDPGATYGIEYSVKY